MTAEQLTPDLGSISGPGAPRHTAAAPTRDSTP